MNRKHYKSRDYLSRTFQGFPGSPHGHLEAVWCPFWSVAHSCIAQRPPISRCILHICSVARNIALSSMLTRRADRMQLQEPQRRWNRVRRTSAQPLEAVHCPATSSTAFTLQLCALALFLPQPSHLFCTIALHFGCSSLHLFFLTINSGF
ncbi:hypothetical protein IQ06DRAFT_95294 [Phaeosphaeriaceae sp. SRC1lsM3a]|nr:hypothetical protein IQ06DRAFT_95294 [Stagonospora sp. SRC1lsM3a]